MEQMNSSSWKSKETTLKRTLPKSFDNTKAASYATHSLKSYGQVYPVLKLPERCTVFESVTPSQCRSYALEIMRRTEKSWSAWGFDIEWRVDFKGGSQRENVVILFHIHRCGLQHELVKVLKDPRIFLLGVNISGDLRKIERDFPSMFPVDSIKSAVDLRDLEQRVLKTKSSSSLAGMVQARLKMVLEKPQNIRTGNWEKSLSPEQKSYAALDVFSTYLLFHNIMEAAIRGEEGLTSSYLISKFVFTILNTVNSKLSPEERTDKSRQITCKCQSKCRFAGEENIAKTGSELNAIPTEAVDLGKEASGTIEPARCKLCLKKGSGLSSISVPASQLEKLEDIITKNESTRDELRRALARNIVPAATELKPLGFSKKAAWDLFMEDGLDFLAIAEKRRVKETTVMNYILEGLRNGYEYKFERFGIRLFDFAIIVVAHLLCAMKTNEAVNVSDGIASAANGAVIEETGDATINLTQLVGTYNALLACIQQPDNDLSMNSTLDNQGSARSLLRMLAALGVDPSPTVSAAPTPKSMGGFRAEEVVEQSASVAALLNRSAAGWMARYQSLVSYCEAHGTGDVHKDVDPELYEWLSEQRVRYWQNGGLQLDRLKLLQDLVTVGKLNWKDGGIGDDKVEAEVVAAYEIPGGNASVLAGCTGDARETVFWYTKVVGMHMKRLIGEEWATQVVLRKLVAEDDDDISTFLI